MGYTLPESMYLFGCRVQPAQPVMGQGYYELYQAEGPVEWGGRHSVFVDVLDGAGKRAVGVPVKFFWNGGQDVKAVEPKAGEEFGLDFPLFASGNAYSVQVGAVSDVVTGLGLVAFKPHVSFKLRYRYAVKGQSSTPSPVEGEVIKYLQEARAALDKAERAYRVGR